MRDLSFRSRAKFFVTIFMLVLSLAVPAATNDWVHIQLKDRLDRPTDGYCLDILGNERYLRIDLPLFAHNCKQGPTADSVVEYTETGQLVFPAAEVCVTAFGVNRTVLPGTSVLLRPCKEETAFFDAEALQIFDYQQNGQFRLRGYDLCLAVGERSSTTYSQRDRWRVLYLGDCASTELSHSAWEMKSLD